MKKTVLFLILTVLLLTMPVLAARPPEKIILHNALYYEVQELQIGKYVQAKKQLPLYLTADESSPVIGSLGAGQPARAVSYELHTSPNQNPYLLTRKIKNFAKDNPQIKLQQPERHDEIFFLAHRGDGTFQAWWQGKIIWIIKPAYTVNIVGSQFWLCVALPETGLEGWTPVTAEDWHSRQAGMFFEDADALTQASIFAQ